MSKSSMGGGNKSRTSAQGARAGNKSAMGGGEMSSGNGTSTGGNVGGNQGEGPSATGGNKNIPNANGSVEQVGNIFQQAMPSIIVGGGYHSFENINDAEDIYDRIITVSQDYYIEFSEDFLNWRINYQPFLRDQLIETAFRTPSYEGDGRGVVGSEQNPDKDLFRRGQMAVSKIKDLCIAWRTKRRITDRYAHGAMRMDDMDISLKRFAAQVDNFLIAERIEDIREDEFNNRRWNRLIAAANIGISGSNTASQGYSTALAQYTNAAQGMANYKTALGNQIAATAGNFAQRFSGDE